jgi:hypothetical protein
MADKSVRFEMAPGGEDSRTMIHLIQGFMARVDALRRQAHFGDMDQAIVAGVVGVGSIEHMMRVPEFREAFGDYQTVIGIDGQRGVNAFSIAQATGIPRETVRRKLKDLVARGVIMEKTRGVYIMKPGFVQQPENVAALQQVLGHFLQIMNDAVNLGIVKMVKS